MKLTSVVNMAKTLPKIGIRATEQQIEVKAPWGKIAAITWGDPSKPPVLLCPGRMDTCATFRPLISLLPRDYFYVGIDLPGNGLSDPFPRGAKLTMMDFIQAVVRIKNHFKWESYNYIGHSLGGVLSKFYNIAYPGEMKTIVELDPMPAYVPNDDFKEWYLSSYDEFYSDEMYSKINSGYDNAPKYKYEEIKSRLMKARRVDETIIEHVLERCLEPTDDGLFRLTFDQRLKLNFFIPFQKETLKELYTRPKTPTLAILSTEYMDVFYYDFPFMTDDKAWPHGNYKHVLLDVGHDVHLHSTKECANLITEFWKGASNVLEVSKL